jgi:transcriptional regulator with XRE-family HTH domain
MKTIEKVREDKKMSQEKLVENITSLRSYYRYLNQDIEIPYDTLLALVSKLHIELSDLILHQDDDIMLDKQLGKLVRHARLHRETESKSVTQSLHAFSLNTRQHTLLKDMMSNRKHALINYLQSSIDMDDVSLDQMLAFVDTGKSFYTFLELVIEKTFDVIESHQTDDYDMFETLLKHFKTKTNDGYINYPLTYLQCHMYVHDTQRFQEAIIKHLSLHHFYDDTLSVKEYTEKLSLLFQKDIQLMFNEFIKKAI